MRLMFVQKVLVAALILFLSAPVAMADLLLSFSGTDGSRTEKNFTVEALESFEQVEIATGNDFVDGVVVFSGPLVRDVLESVSADAEGMVKLTAANDYSIDIQAEEFLLYDVIFALRADGVSLSRRDKGPIWLMYPIDGTPGLQVPSTNNKLIWQLVQMDMQ